MQQYFNSLWTNRVGYVDWKQLTNEVEWNVIIASENF
jgi:hypothetical protein